MSSKFARDVVVIGGGGHVGLPLALMFADVGYKVNIFDINKATVDCIKRGEMPFAEVDGTEVLQRVLKTGRLEVSHTPEGIADCKYIIMIVGTPIDEHLNPKLDAIHTAIAGCRAQLRDGQVMILRSTLFPGTSNIIQRTFDEEGLKIDVSFCPERVVQGNSFHEFKTIPQIISSFKPGVKEQVRELFSKFTKDFVEMEPIEAELCKLMTNAWRYIQFATVNQFYTIATKHGLDFNRILYGCRHNYPRMVGMPGPGLSAGPCLVKDTMQLAAFSQNQFYLGHAAMLVNEGLTAHMIDMARPKVKLGESTAGILGMAFKSGSDDHRDSLSYKMKKQLKFEAKEVLCTDPYVADDSLLPLNEVLEKADVFFICTPHPEYKGLKMPKGKVVVDVWNCVAPSSS